MLSQSTQTYAVVRSGSYAVAASLILSAMVLFSELVMSLLSPWVQRRDERRYPVGKTHFEPMAVGECTWVECTSLLYWPLTLNY